MTQIFRPDQLGEINIFENESEVLISVEIQFGGKVKVALEKGNILSHVANLLMYHKLASDLAEGNLF